MKIQKGKHYTYLLIDPRTKIPFYVGKGINNRALQHLTDNYTKSYNPLKTNKINSILKEGYEIGIEILYQNNEPEAYLKEQELIKQYGRKDIGTGPLTNLNDGGSGGNTGYKMPPEVLSKLKNRKRGIKTEDGLQKIREAVSGPKSKEHKRKLQENCPSAKPVLQFTREGEFINRYVSAREAFKQTGVDNAQISRCCTGHYKSAGGYFWIYENSSQG